MCTSTHNAPNVANNTIMPTRKHIFLLEPHCRDDNLGDQVIFSTLASSLSRFGSVYLTRPSPKTIPNARLEPAKWPSRLVRLRAKAAGGEVFFILPPGAMLRNFTPKNSERHTQNDGIRRLFADWLAGHTVQIGISVSPDSRLNGWSHFAWIGARDHKSVKALRNAGFTQTGYFPDLSFLLKANPTNPAIRDRVAFTFRHQIPDPLGGLDVACSTTTAMNWAADGLRASPLSSACELCGFFQVDEDAPHTQELSAGLGVAFEPDRLSLTSYRSFYSRCEVVISNRLHSLLIGARCGAIPIALTASSHAKLISLFETVGWSDLLINHKDRQACRSRLLHILNNLAKYRSTVADTFSAQSRLGNLSLRQAFSKHGLRSFQPHTS